MADERNLAEALAASISAETKTLRTLVDLLSLGGVVSDAQGAITSRRTGADLVRQCPGERLGFRV